MLIRFQMENFLSLRDGQTLSMVASSALKDAPEATVAVEPGLRLLRSAGMYGANASGKSNVLKALRWFAEAISESHRLWEPDQPIRRQPFGLDVKWRARPTVMQLDFLLDGVRYQYGFALNDAEILREWL